MNLTIGHFSPKYQAIALLFVQTGSFSSLFNLQSKWMNFNFGHFSPNYQGYSLTFWPKMSHFHHFSICNQNEWISLLVIFRQNTKAIALLFGQNWLIFITFNLQSTWMNFNFGHFSPKYQGYSLTFWLKMAHFHHLSICNQNEWIWLLVIFHPKYQGYSLTFCPKLAHFHHFSICNQNEWISSLVIFRQNIKAIALRFGLKWLIFITVNLQSKWMNLTIGHFSPKYQGYSLTFCPKLAHFHHFSICNQNEWISILVIFRQNTKAIALLFGQIWLIFITFQSAIKMNEFQFWSFFAKIPRL